MADFFAACPKHLEPLLASELEALGADNIKQTVAGVSFSCTPLDIYSICLHSRIANRVLKPLSSGAVESDANLYDLASRVRWVDLFEPWQTFFIDFIGTNDVIRNSQFGAQRVKDAIVDQFVGKTGKRPAIDKHDADVRVQVRLARNKAHFSLDLSGDSLHKRGYRKLQGEAPLKENLAAAILLRSGWANMSNKGGILIDPMCGSGTFLIEGALIALDIAPGVYRNRFGFEGLKDFDQEYWLKVRADAVAHKNQALETANFEYRGYDIEYKVLDAAEANVIEAGLSKFIKLMRKPVNEFKKPTHKQFENGLVICNPPYGERLGEVESLKSDYRQMARAFKTELPGWTFGVFTGNPELGREMRLRPKNKYKMFNGRIESTLLLFDLKGSDTTLRYDAVDQFEESGDINAPLSEGAQMVFNRLQKNDKKLKAWRLREEVGSYRIYDADIPEYSAAIDVYENVDSDKYIHIQEYQAPKTIDNHKAQKRFKEIQQAVFQYFQVGPDHVSCKLRKRNRGTDQYQKQIDHTQKIELIVEENNAKYLVNLTEYLDTGLFLDHRPLRRQIAQSINGKSFLNLFCYTGTATVLAAVAGASESISVDMSNRYLEWAKHNLSLNYIRSNKHQLVRADCLKWLAQCRRGFDVIFLDPPSFSNSKKMDGVLDIQRDHEVLIQRCVEILKPGGILYFSTNLRSFKLNESLQSLYHVMNISHETIDPDFEKNIKIHQCWHIQAKK